VADGLAVINAGSSSVKFAVYEATRQADCLLRGQIEGIGVSPRLRIFDSEGREVQSDAWSAAFDHEAATREILARVPALIPGRTVGGIGHRVVHGGMQYDRPVRVTRDVLSELSKLER